MFRQYALSIFLLGASLQSSVAFSPSTSLQRLSISGVPSTSCVYMSEEPVADEPEASAEGESTEEEHVPEDPEVVAIKEEIAQLESELKSKQSTLQYAQDQVEEYSKGGYARKVAEMENMRRVRKSINTSSRSSATAGILADFLPVYDQFIDLKEKYSNDEFGAKFAGLSIADTFSKMGVTEYSVEAGQAVDNFRVAVVENEYSTEFAKDTVIHPIAPGMELEGNVIRAAQCVASAGSEEEAAAEADVSEQQE